MSAAGWPARRSSGSTASVPPRAPRSASRCCPTWTPVASASTRTRRPSPTPTCSRPAWPRASRRSSPSVATPAVTAVSDRAGAGRGTVPGRRRLSALDTSFLALESATTPMHVGALDPAWRVARSPTPPAGCASTPSGTRSRRASSRCPRMRQRIASVPFGAGRPVWIDDQAFDIAHHVRSIDLPPPGSRDQLVQLCCELQMQVLDRTRPLWEMWFVGGLADGSVGLVYKVHHAVVDGVSAAETFELLLDPGPLARLSPLGCDAQRHHAGTSPAPRGYCGQPRRRLAHGGAGRAPTASRASCTRGLLLAAGRRSGSSPRTNDARSPHLAQPVTWERAGGSRRWISTSPRSSGSDGHGDATVNDVVLTLVASGLSELLASRGESMPGRPDPHARFPPASG